MLEKIPFEVLDVYKKIKSAGFEVFFVGGCVRNILLKKAVKDWDLTTNATPEEILQIFKNGFYDNEFGTVGIPVESSRTQEPEGLAHLEIIKEENLPKEIIQNKKNARIIIEITTYRTERDYKNFRHPTVAWGKSIHEDLERRDFTINAIALNVLQNNSPDFELIDPYSGQKDLENKIIRAVGEPTKRFKEDALRLLRAVRFATQLSFTIEDNTWKAMLEDSPLIAAISGERIRDELLKILSTDFPYEGIMLLKNANLLTYILPEILEGVNLSQTRPGRHHIYDVFTHNVMSLKLCPSKEPIVRFATLIHDVGKSRVVGKDENGLVIFYNHEIKGAQMAYEICNRLHFSKKDRNKIVNLIRWHMFSVDEHVSDAGVRRFIRRVGVENVKDMIDLRIGDRLGSGIPEERAESWRLKKFKERIEEQLRPAPFSINDLAIDGNDIIKEFDIKPGPKIGEILQKLFEEVDENLELNNKEFLIKRAKEIYYQ